MRKYCCIIGVWRSCGSRLVMADAGFTARAGNGVRSSGGAAMNLLHQFQQQRKDLRCAADDASVFEESRFAVEVRNQSSGLEDQQAAGRHVPGRQADFPEAVEPSGGDIGKVERGSTGSTDPSRVLGDALEHAHVLVEMLEAAERKAGANQAFA